MTHVILFKIFYRTTHFFYICVWSVLILILLLQETGTAWPVFLLLLLVDFLCHTARDFFQAKLKNTGLVLPTCVLWVNACENWFWKKYRKKKKTPPKIKSCFHLHPFLICILKRVFRTENPLIFQANNGLNLLNVTEFWGEERGRLFWNKPTLLA